MADTDQVNFGTIKWFGGENSKTGKINHFGFIQDITGADVFIHKKEWKGISTPSEGDFVSYKIQEKDGRFSAINAQHLKDYSSSPMEIFNAINTLNRHSNFSFDPQHTALENILAKTISKASYQEIIIIKNDPLINIYELISRNNDWQENFEFLIKITNSNITDEEPWEHSPRGTIEKYQHQIAEQLIAIKKNEARDKAILNLRLMPIDLIVFLIAKDVLSSGDDIEPVKSEVTKYVQRNIIDKEDLLPDYVNEAFEKTTEGNPLRSIINLLLLKKSLYEKNENLIIDFKEAEIASSNLEAFVLYNIFSLLISGNNIEVVYQVFLNRLWEAITTKTIDIKNQNDQILILFPACNTLNHFSRKNKLSCEAVYWEKAEIYLCRGKPCAQPKVIPDTKKNYIGFNIYDWFSHYGIEYGNNTKPSSKDFPIKLAGYFNRLQELREVLDCQKCGNLMLPNMRYARTEYKELINGQLVTKDMAAAYRLTVFHCNNGECVDFNNGYYINHCVSYGCYSLIDSRHLKLKCSNGLYICKGCGGCCPIHSKSNPEGLCPDCGSSLIVFDYLVRGITKDYYARSARCSSDSCKFQIPSSRLPSKFKTIKNVRIENTMPNISEDE